ncbi:hypothetical protein JCM30566_04840 [Marinitoga arctica]
MIEKNKKLYKKKQHIFMLAILIILIFNSCIINLKPPKPILTYPKENMLNDLPLKIDISWITEDINSKNLSYEVYYGKSEELLNNKLTTKNTYITIENLEPETDYYLKIRSVKGNNYNDSIIYHFKTTDVPKINLDNYNPTIYSKNLPLSWNATDNDGIKEYYVYISLNENFSDSTLLYRGVYPSYTISNLQYGNTYYIKLVAYDKLNVNAEKTIVINVSDLKFYNISPSDNETGIPVDSIKLSWEYSTNSNNYTLILSPNNDLSDDSNLYKYVELTKNEYIINDLPPGMTFYWKIIDNNTKYESPIFKFTTSYKPEVEITYPKKTLETENYAVGVPINARITWNATDNDNDNLNFNIKLKEIQKNDDINLVDFSNNLLLDEETTDNYFDVTLKKDAYYALKIFVNDGKGNEAESIPIKFRTNLDPTSPYDLYPNNLIDIPTKIATLTWNGYDPDNEISYNVYFGETLNSLSLKGTTTNTYYTLYNLEYGKNYYWQIEAMDSDGATSISSIATFMTNKKPVFISVSPSNDSTNLSLKPILNWNFEDSNIKEYHLYFSKSSEKLSLIATLTNNNYHFDNYLLPESPYKWEVIAYDSLNSTETSGVNYFNTTNTPIIDLISPIGNNESLKPIFTWIATDTDSDELLYKLYLKFPDEKLEEYTTSSTYFEYPNLLETDSNYSWSLLVEDSNLATNISSTQTFITSKEPTVTLISPIGEESMNASVTLKWTGSDPENDSLYYEIIVNNTLYGTTTENEYILNDLLPNTEYTWKIKVIDNKYAFSFSNEATFVTSKAPEINPNITNIFDFNNPTKEYSFNEVKYPNKLKIIWENSNADYYNVYKFANNIETAIATNITDNYAYIEIPEGGNYNIYVKAFNLKGFFTKGNEIPLKFNKPPFIQDYFPQDMENNVSLNPKIQWIAEDFDDSVFSATIYFGKDKNNLENEYISNAQNISEYSINKTLDSSSTYYWKIVLMDDMGGYNETEFRQFTTTHKPEISSINITNNSTNISLEYNLNWEAFDIDNDKLIYDLKITSGNNIILSEKLENNNYILNLDADENYTLEITVTDEKGSSDSTIINLSTTKNPIIYDNSLISDSLTHFKNGDKIYWNAYDPDGDELYYEIYLGTSYNSLNKITTTTQNEYQLTDLEEGKTYYWKIIVFDNKGGTVESNIKSFTTNSSPIFENNYYPINESFGIEKSVTLSWEAKDNENDILKYDIYFGENKFNLSKIATDYTYSNFNIGNLENNKTYYWKVTAKDDYNGITESTIMSFTVNTPPILKSLNYEVHNGLEIKLSWEGNDPEGQSITYDLLKSTDGTNYSTVLFNTTSKEYYFERLKPNTTYYYTVRVIDEKDDYYEGITSVTTKNTDTKIFTIERGANSENDVIDCVEFSNEFVIIEKDGNNYFLTKLDNTGTETTKNSSVTINFTPYSLNLNTDKLLLFGIDSGNLIINEYDNNLNENSTSTTIPVNNINDYLKINDTTYIILDDEKIFEINISDGSILDSFSETNVQFKTIVKYLDNGNTKYLIGSSVGGKGYLYIFDDQLNKENIIEINDIDNVLKIKEDATGFLIFGFNNNDLVIKKYSKRFNILLTPKYENNYQNDFIDVVKTSDGYVILLNDENGDIEALKIDENINVLEKIKFGRDYEEKSNGIIQTSDNGYIIFGQTKSFSDKINGNSYIIKTDSNFIGWNTPE